MQIHENESAHASCCSEDADLYGRDFTVQPVLLVRQCRPGIRHAQIALVGGLPFRALGKLKAVVGVIPEDVRLFHIEDVGTELSLRNRPYRIVTPGNFARHRSLDSHADSCRDQSWPSSAPRRLPTVRASERRGDRVPTATDVITGLYTFSRFQQGLLESTDLKGNAEVKNLAALRAEEAGKRDKTLKKIQDAIGAEPHVARRRQLSASLVEPENADGPTYVRSFYAAQIPEYESAISLLERYLKAPDNPALAAFAREQLPMLRTQVKDAERTMADK